MAVFLVQKKHFKLIACNIYLKHTSLDFINYNLRFLVFNYIFTRAMPVHKKQYANNKSKNAET